MEKGGEVKSRKQKKQWQRPQLVVLVRNRPEEGILNSCKQADVTLPAETIPLQRRGS